MIAADRMEFRLLGALEVEGQGRLAPLGSAKQRALLAILLLHANEPVSRDVLIDDLWGERPPVSAPHSLEVYVSRLRKTLHADGDGVIVTRPGAYLLQVDPEQLDVRRFEQLVTEGRRDNAAGAPAEAAARLQEALALWRGRALADFAFESFAQLEIERLEELRLVALEEWIEAELALGSHGALVGELETLTRRHPHRERLRGQLMLALYRSGRQAEALEVYQETRRRLVEELGIAPSKELQRLEQAILRQDPALDLEAPPRGTDDRHALAPAELQSPRAVMRAGWRRALLAACAGGVALAAVAVMVVLLTRGSSGLAGIDFNGVGAIDPRSGKIVGEVVPAASLEHLTVGYGSVWGVNPDENNLWRIDSATKNVQTIPVGNGPSGIAAAAGAVWVANNLDGTVSRVDPATNREVDPIPVGKGPTAVTAAAGSLWVTNAGDRTVTQIDLRTDKRVKTIPSGADGRGIAVGGGAVWVSDESSDSVVRIDLRNTKVVQPIPVGTGPTGVLFAAGSVWVANTFGGTVSRIDPRENEVAGTIPVGGSPTALAATPGRLWVADEQGQRIDAIDLDTKEPVRPIAIGSRPQALAADDKALWVTVQASPRAHRGGTLRILSAPGDFDYIDPALAYGLGTWNMLSVTNDGLVRFKRVGGSDGTQIVPDLATSLPVPSDGGTIYSFQLRPGIRYSNGRPVEPADFRHALERVFKLSSPGRAYYEGILGGAACARHPRRCDLSRGVATDDRTRTVTFHLTAPDSEFLDKLALPFADAVPARTPTSEAIRPLPATGPYLIARYLPQRKELTLVRNPRFRAWSTAAQPDGYPDRIEWRWKVTPQAAALAIEQGRADFMLDNPPARLLPGIETRYASQIHVLPTARVYYIFLNTRRPPFQNIRVRRALNYALDRRRILRLVGDPRLGRPTCQVLPPLLPGYRPYCPYTRNPGRGGIWTAPDLRRARQLIAASHTRGTHVVVWSPAEQPVENMTRYVVHLLRRLGYRSKLKTMPGDRYWNEIGTLNAQAGEGAWVPDYPSASAFFAPLLECRGGVNWSHFCDPGVDRLVKQALALQTKNPQAENLLWARIDRRVVDEAALVPYEVPQNVDFVSKRVGDYQLAPSTGVLIDQLWIR